MTRSKNLTDDDIESIVKILDGWSGVLQWDLLIGEVEKVLFRKYTRQGLDKHPRIKAAFTNKKVDLASRGDADRKVASSPELQLATDRIARLEAELARVKAENNSLLEQFNRWAYNASLRSLDEQYLSRPLPAVDRGQSKVTPKVIRGARGKEGSDDN